MTTIFNECADLKAELDNLTPLSADDEQRIMQKFRLDWNYHSNHLEGNSLSYGETKALILFGITAQGKPLKDHFEITGHNEAINWVLEVIKEDRPLSENFIRELHKLILKEPYEVDTITPDGNPSKKMINVGQYKTSPNHVKTKTGEIFRFATPEDTPIKMNELVQWYNEKSISEDVNPILLAAEFHYRYIRIHPFDDGNGRTARILMNFILLRFNYPPVIVKTEDKANYFAALRQADAGLFTAFAEYIANNLKDSLALMIAGAKGESIEEKDDLEKEIALLEQEVRAVGQPLNPPKEIKRLFQIFDDSFNRTTKYYLEKNSAFERLYFNISRRFMVNGQLLKSGHSLQDVRDQLSENTSIISVNIEFFNFKQSEFEEMYFSGGINFLFKNRTYIVSNKSNVEFSKSYNENLSQVEIEALVHGEVRRHKEAIEKRIKEIRNKKLS